jgi:hypothetical protein
MSIRRLLVLLLIAAIVARSSPAEPTPATALLVLSKQDHTLAIVDPANLRVVARVSVGEDPHEVIASENGRTAYVSNYGFGQFHTITMIDLIGQKQIGTIDLGALRAARVGLCRRQVVVHRGGSEVDRQLRSGVRQGGPHHWHRAEPDAHGLRFSRQQTYRHDQRELGDGDGAG